jgi:hypothetical protein
MGMMHLIGELEVVVKKKNLSSRTCYDAKNNAFLTLAPFLQNTAFMEQLKHYYNCYYPSTSSFPN